MATAPSLRQEVRPGWLGRSRVPGAGTGLAPRAGNFGLSGRACCGQAKKSAI